MIDLPHAQALVADSIPMHTAPAPGKTFGRGFHGMASDHAQNASRNGGHAASAEHPPAPIAAENEQPQGAENDRQAFSGGVAKPRPQLQIGVSPAQQRAEAVERKTKRSQTPAAATGRLNLKRTRRH